MPLYTVDIQKVQGTEYWTNRYVMVSPSLGQAANDCTPFATAEIAIHTQNVRIDKARVRPLAKGGDNYIIIPYGFDGGYDGGSLGDQIPLFNVVRADFQVSEGRPSRKYYRVGLTEGMVNGSTVVEAYRAFVDTKLEQMIAALGGKFVDVDGQGIDHSTVFPAVSMRQLRRGSKRKARPVI